MSDHHPPEEIGNVVSRYLRRFETLGWNRFTGFDWDSIEAHRLTEMQLDALKTAMLVEDHIPSYSRVLHELYALRPDLPPQEIYFRRQMLHFVFRWSCDEDRHAQTLENYLRACGRVDLDALAKEMAATVVVPFKIPHQDAMQMVVYTVIQEKATQVFYSCLRDAVEEPVLKKVLSAISQDEARHCGFFTDLLRLHLEAPGGIDCARIKEAVVNFKMPLYGAIDNYKRRSILMMRAAKGYHFRDAFELIEQAVRRYADARTDSRTSTLQDLLDALETKVNRPRPTEPVTP